MLIPTLSDIVYSLGKSIDEVIAPALTGLRERSAITTVRHMLRYVEHAVENEGQLLYDEAARLRQDLSRVADNFARKPALGAVADSIRATLAQRRAPEVYPSPSLLVKEVTSLRQCADDALVALHGLAADDRDDGTAETHQILRDYIRWQLEEEERLIQPAFVGFGARR